MTNYTLTATTGAIAISVTPITAATLVSMTEGATLTLSQALAFVAGAEVDETIRVSLASLPTTIYGLTTAEQASVQASLQAMWSAVLAENMTLSDALTVALGVVVLDRLKIASVADVMARYGLTLVELIQINDGLFRLLSGVLADTILVGDTPGVVFFPCASVVDAMVLTEALGATLLMHVTVPEGVMLTDAQLLRAIYSDSIDETITITAAYVSPDGTLTAWAINTRTNAVTEYQNWEFNSFVKMGHKYLGLARDGLYELDGVDDAGVSIPTYIRSGLFQPGGSRYSSFKAAYLGMRTDADDKVFLKLILGNGAEYIYAAKVQDMHTTRVNFGKGLRSRYYAWELMTTGADFDLESVTFIPLVALRRVG